MRNCLECRLFLKKWPQCTKHCSYGKKGNLMDWIKVSEKLPEDGRHVIIYTTNGDIWYNVEFDLATKTFYDETETIIAELELDEVTHWQPFLNHRRRNKYGLSF